MKLRYVPPPAALLVLVTALMAGLSRDPHELPSPLAGKSAPALRLTTLESTVSPLTPQDLHGKAWMLNIQASWYIACYAEHAVLNALTEQSAVPVYGLDYKDDVNATRARLKQMGDPYVTLLIDADGKVDIDYGVYGMPETSVIDCAGAVHCRQVGPVTAESMERRIMPPLQ